jgi:hypothetical protein
LEVVFYFPWSPADSKPGGIQPRNPQFQRYIRSFPSVANPWYYSATTNSYLVITLRLQGAGFMWRSLSNNDFNLRSCFLPSAWHWANTQAFGQVWLGIAFSGSTSFWGDGRLYGTELNLQHYFRSSCLP